MKVEQHTALPEPSATITMTRALVLSVLLFGSCASLDPTVLGKLKKLPQLPTLESLLDRPPVTTSFTRCTRGGGLSR